MKMVMGIIIILIVIGLVGFSIYARTSPYDAADYDQSPKTAPSDGKPHEFRLTGEDAPVFDVSADVLKTTTDSYALAQPRVKRIAGDPQSQVMTYEVRSLVMGYPDFVSIEIEAIDDNSSRFNVFSRSRIGRSDLGANKKRVEEWVKGIGEELAEN